MEFVWYIVAALGFSFQTVLMALHSVFMLKTNPWFLADISTRSIFGDFQATPVYASVCCQFRHIHISLFSTVYYPFPLPAVNKCWVETNIFISEIVCEL